MAVRRRNRDLLARCGYTCPNIVPPAREQQQQQRNNYDLRATRAAYRIKKPSFKGRGFLGSCRFIYGQSSAGCRGGLRLGRIARIAVSIVRAIYFGLAYRRQ